MKRREPVSTRVCLSPSPDPCLPRQETQEMRVSSLGWEDTLEEGIATHFSILGLPWWLRQERICLQCRRPRFGSWIRKVPWRRKWQSTPALFSGKSHGRRRLIGYSPWGCKQLDTTEQLHFLSFFLWGWVATTEFSKFSDMLRAALSWHHLLGFEIAQLKFYHLH